MRPPITLIISALVIAIPSQLFPQSARRMVSACLTISAAETSDRGIRLTQDFETGFCSGAFSTLQKVVAKVDASEATVYGVCGPPDSRLSQLIAVFVNYARDHPERLHEPYFDVALASLRQAFPCTPTR